MVGGPTVFSEAPNAVYVVCVFASGVASKLTRYSAANVFLASLIDVYTTGYVSLPHRCHFCIPLLYFGAGGLLITSC